MTISRCEIVGFQLIPMFTSISNNQNHNFRLQRGWRRERLLAVGADGKETGFLVGGWGSFCNDFHIFTCCTSCRYSLTALIYFPIRSMALKKWFMVHGPFVLLGGVIPDSGFWILGWRSLLSGMIPDSVFWRPIRRLGGN